MSNGLLLRKPSRSGAEALRALRGRNAAFRHDLSDLEIAWPTGVEMLEHAAHLVGDAVVHDTRGRPPVLATIIAPPLRAYVADSEGEELTRFGRLVRELADRSVREVGGVSIIDRQDAWRLGTGPLIDWYWSNDRDPDALRVRRARLDQHERQWLNDYVLVAITGRNRVAFDGHLRAFLPELVHGGSRR